MFALEGIILFDFAAGRKFSALLGDALDVAAKLDLLGQQRLAGAAIFGTLVGKANITRAGQVGGGFQVGTARGFQAGTAHGVTSFSANSTYLVYKTFRRPPNPTPWRIIFFSVPSASTSLLRGAKRRSNPVFLAQPMVCFACTPNDVSALLF
jgi:hypothetical protein